MPVIVSWLPVVVPLWFIAIGYGFGKAPSRAWAAFISLLLPTIIGIGISVEPLRQVSSRFDDRNLDERLVEGNGIKLVWAPAGPGWPKEGVNWYEAQERCAYLAKDGKTLAKEPQHIWRLPTADEVVRCMTIRNRNCGGSWDSVNKKAIFRTRQFPGSRDPSSPPSSSSPSQPDSGRQMRPDKESPLWDIYSPIIYWWTSTEEDETHAYIIVYDGQAHARKKKGSMGSRSFRAVRDYIEPAPPTETPVKDPK